MRTGGRLFWTVWAIGAVAVAVDYAVDWLNTGAFAGALGLLAALALTEVCRDRASIVRRERYRASRRMSRSETRPSSGAVPHAGRSPRTCEPRA
ncbi:MAG: hypothetical protein M3292_08950 [Actinomycetota bacterium]|nr:hypothetical protein [Actinomycetota bacterium]